MNPEGLLYTKEHEWLKVEGDTGTIGITDHAQSELGDVVYVEFPKVGQRLQPGKTLGTIESVKAVSEIFSPVEGKVLEVNSSLTTAPETVNSDPYGKGWLVRLRIAKVPVEGLLSAQEYSDYTAQS